MCGIKTYRIIVYFQRDYHCFVDWFGRTNGDFPAGMMSLLECGADCCAKLRQFAFIQRADCPYAAAHVHAERTNAPNGLCHVVGVQAPCEEDRYAYGFAYGAADVPIMDAARATEFLYGQQRVAEVQQERVDVGSDANGFFTLRSSDRRPIRSRLS